MEIYPESTKLLTNYEVYSLFKELCESKKKVSNQQTLIYSTLKYFKNKSVASSQTKENIISFKQKIESFGLKDQEINMLINNCPTTLVELSLVNYFSDNFKLISEVDARYSNEDLESILKLIKDCFPESIVMSSTINGLEQDKEEDEEMKE